MIDLNLLQEKDPATWQQIVRGPPMIPYHKYYAYDIDGSATAHKDERAYIPFDELLPEVACAWLQHVLQDACQARGWLLEQNTFTMKPSAKIWTPGGSIYNTYMGVGDSPAEALLRCYQEAIG